MLQLPVKSVEVGWEGLQDEFHKLMDAAKKKKDHDDIFDQLKAAVVDNSVSKHVWEDKAAEVLKVIQLNTLEDRLVVGPLVLILVRIIPFYYILSIFCCHSGQSMTRCTGTEPSSSCQRT